MLISLESSKTNKWIKIMLIPLSMIIISFYFFPFEFTFLPGYNTKKIMAAIGIPIFLIKTAKKKNFHASKDAVILMALAAIVSAIAFTSVTINHTADYSYATYIISAIVWLSGAYVAINWIKYVHGEVNLRLACDYLIAVCVMQCFLAVLIDSSQTFSNFVNSFMGGFASMRADANALAGYRLYGIGAALDVAGSRFATILIIISYQIKRSTKNNENIRLFLYFISFIIIVIIGNMVARTTTVGAIVAIFYYLLPENGEPVISKSGITRFFVYSSLLILACGLSIHLYNHDEQFRDNLRFGFEGFFALAEDGYWHTNSNDMLLDMYRLPENAKTWLIGDGYFDNPTSDPNYLGHLWKGFYMGTDVGYLRFLFYFGIIGLLFFCVYMLYSAHICAKEYPNDKTIFYLVLLMNFLVWFKVSTDLFIVFAFFICTAALDDDKLINNE